MMSVPDRSLDPKILESARKEFLENGFEKASLKDICEGAGVTTGALYKRYKGKEDLFAAVVEQTVQELYAVAKQRGEPGSCCFVGRGTHEVLGYGWT